jgi:predicted metalloprotease with PDZ domain
LPLEWRFDNPPKVRAVEPGSPAAEAGIEAGDKITHVDGLKIDSEDGGKRFSSIKPGQTVEIKVRRNGIDKAIDLQATEPPQAVLERDLMCGLDPESMPVRFLETSDGAKIEVRGEDSVRVTRDESAGEIVIRTRDAFVRIKLPDKKN